MAKHQWSSTHDHLPRLAAHNYQQYIPNNPQYHASELEYATNTQTQVGGGAPDYEDSYQEYGVEEEVLSCGETSSTSAGSAEEAEDRIGWDRSDRPRTGSVGTDRLGRFCTENRDDAKKDIPRGIYFGVSVGALNEH